MTTRTELAPTNLPTFSAQWLEDCFRWRGRLLFGQQAHWCWDWDGLPVDETCDEHECCTCYDEPRP